MRSTTQAAPLLLALQREILERDAWPVLRAALPGQSEGYWAAARDVHLDSHAPAELADAERSDCLLTDPGAGEHERARRGRPGAAGARRPHARAASASSAMARRWCGTVWPTPAGAQQAGMATRRLRRADRARAVPRPRRSGRRVGRAHDRQARLIERLSSARELRIEAEGTDLRAERRGAHLGELRRQAQHALRRGLHRPARGLRRGPHPLHDPVEPARRRGRRDRAALRGGPRRRGARRPRRGLPARDARHRRRRVAARRDRHRHELRHRPAGRA